MNCPRSPRRFSEASGEAAQQNESQLRAILETAVEGIITIDRRGIISTINPAALRMFCYDAEELIGQNVNVLMPSPDREAHDQYLANYLRTGEKKIIGIGREVTGKRKDGTTFPMDLSVAEFRLDGQPYFTGFVRDIAERKEAEEELRRERDFAQRLLTAAQSIILVLDTQGRIVRFNRFTEELTGYRLEEVQGKDWFHQLLPERDRNRIRDTFHRSLDDIDTRGILNPIVIRDGTERQISWWSKTLKDAGGTTIGLLAVGHDVTELLGSQQRALQAERLAAIGQMVSVVSHESRNYLQRIHAASDMLQAEFEDNRAALEEVARIQTASDGLGALLEEIRSYAGPMHLDRSDWSIAHIWRQAWSCLQPQRKNREVTLHERIDGVELDYPVDAFRFGQVFRNLFENALAAASDPVHVEIECTETALPWPESRDNMPAIQIAVRDNGPGLTAEEQSKIFDAFYTTKTKGTGLGMAISRRVVEAHGGQIDINGEYSGGAEFFILLPRISA